MCTTRTADGRVEAIRQAAQLYRLCVYLLVVQASALVLLYVAGTIQYFLWRDMPSSYFLVLIVLTVTVPWSATSYAALIAVYRRSNVLGIPKLVPLTAALILIPVHFAIDDAYLHFAFPCTVTAGLLASIIGMRRNGVRLQTPWPRDRDVERLVRDSDSDPFRMEDRL